MKAKELRPKSTGELQDMVRTNQKRLLEIRFDLEGKRLKNTKEIKTLKTEARKIVKLDEKVKAQRQIKDMEKKRNGMRLNLFKLQDEADERKEKLIEEIEGRLRQKIRVNEVFLVKWKIS